jgi:hypothetical protein
VALLVVKRLLDSYEDLGKEEEAAAAAVVEATQRLARIREARASIRIRSTELLQQLGD